MDSGKDLVVAAKSYKKVIGSIDKRWRGFEQHDTEEYLSFLLSCLHDDLNRVKGRPPVQDVNEKQEDEDYAKAIWEEEKRRNDSFVDDTFKGLFRSKIVCPSCDLHATKFDMCYSIPLQIPTSKGFKKVNVTFVPPTGHTPKALSTVFPVTSTISELRTTIAKHVDVPENSLVMVETSGVEIIRPLMDDDETISRIRNSVFIYQLSSDASGGSLGHVIIPVYQRCLFPVSVPGGGYKFVPELVGAPILMSFPRRIGYKELHEKLEKRVADFVKVVDVDDTKGIVDSTGEGEKNNITGSAGVKKKLSSPEEALRSFEISSLDMHTEKWDRLHNLDDSFKFSLSPGKILAIDWCLQGMKYRRYKRIECESVTNVSPFGGDEKKHLTLEDCLKDFVKEEILSPEDMWYCPKCKEHRQASKKMDIWRAPKILRIDLKRFQNMRGFFSQKLDTFIEFPIRDLDISQFVSGPSEQEENLYDLYAVSRHLGYSAQSGHYTAYCKNSLDNKWYHFDDERVSVVEEDKVVTKDAYLLFYKRKSVKDDFVKSNL
eukprot:TRINITY_DN7446_c0_g1_i1.p1 TRINITY_DN7446_c0_g1~~TRINITY_DN7446_c0_g1_i1.p1  ORF type:complete len:619 (-),score=120.15 TRINITY_DN7446_c0_g1_i1:93-1724(-)